MISHGTDASEPQFGPFEEVEDEEVGLCEDRALKPLVPAMVTFCEITGAAGFWANSVPAGQRSQRTFPFGTTHNVNMRFHAFDDLPE